MPSKVAFDPEEPSLGRIRADAIVPPHSVTSIKRCIARVEGNRVISWPGYFDLFADTSESCDTPFKEGHISSLLTDGPGLNPNEPMAIVQLKPPPIILEGCVMIKNRAAHIYWHHEGTSDPRVYFTTYLSSFSFDTPESRGSLQVNNYSPIIQVFKG